jgi:hypothetical protein
MRMMNFFETKLINATEFNALLFIVNPLFFEYLKGTTGKINEHNLGILFITIPQKGFDKIDH